MARGTLRIYLGAAPGVGKTVAMLDEGARRLARGTDVVVAFADTHGRTHTAQWLGDLPSIEPLQVTYRGARFEEMDLAAVLARRPAVALVDELAHTNVPGSGSHVHRWEDVADLLDAEIDVIGTLNIEHLESLNDVVEQITGVPQHETVPDAVVRAAEQLELVDMTPEALRRRMAHGNVYPLERVDAALGTYFRVGNLTALRELALLWLADRVDEGLQRYKAEHHIDHVWEARERVVVALTGGHEAETLIRRAFRVAQRSGNSALLAVHVLPSDGLAGASPGVLPSQRALVESLGGSYHQVIGDDVATALLEFARSVDATQLVIGTSRRSRWARALRSGIGGQVIADSGEIDVHIVTHAAVGSRGLRLPPLTGALTARRRWLGLALVLAGVPALTALLLVGGAAVSLSVVLLTFLLLVLAVALVGGLWPALAAAVLGALAENWFFVDPTGKLHVQRIDDLVALFGGLVVAVTRAPVVGRPPPRAPPGAPARGRAAEP